MKHLITGFFGVNNLGDDIMLEAFYRSSGKKNELSLLRLYPGRGTDTPIKTNNISMFPHGKSILVDQYYSRIYDGLFWIGGTCMTDSAGDGAYGYMNSYKKRGKKIGYIGIGINEIHNPKRRDAYKDILDRADIVTIRDIKSYEIAKELSGNPCIQLTEDLVYLSDEILAPPVNDEIRRLLIAWRSLAGYYSREIENRALDVLLKVVDKHKAEYDEVVITSLGNQVDVEVNRKLYEMLNQSQSHVRFVEELNYRKRIDLIRSAATVITGRLHGVFISEWNNINTVAIGYDTKVDSFLKSIDRRQNLVFPDTMSVDSIEAALTNRPVELTREEWNMRRCKSMKNIEMFDALA